MRAAALEALLAPRQKEAEVDDELFARMMSVCVAEEVDPAYLPLFREDMAELANANAPYEVPEADDGRKVLIIGAGISGICAAIKLQDAGIEFLIVDRNDGIGGTWWENTYPECGVDTPNHFYSYSFRPNLHWSSYFSKQAEVLAYLEEVVGHFGIRKHIRLSTEVLASDWDEARQCWSTTVRAKEGGTETLDSDFVVVAVGIQNRPALPKLPGLESFQGPLFHTARWRHDVDLTGMRVAMVGTGASAMQVARTVAAKAAQLTVFQRSPQWVIPNPDYHRTVSDRKKWLLQNVPHYAEWYRFVRFWRYGDGLLATLVKDPEWEHPERSVNATNDRHRRYMTRYIESELEGRPDLVAKAMPTYPPYGKRMLVDNDWFKTLRRDNVELVTDDIHRITRDGIQTSDGAERTFDVVIMATGFESRRMLGPIQINGRRPISEIWGEDDASAYQGITIPGIPNLFMLHGPNTGLAHGGSVIFHTECQVRYLVGPLIKMRERGVAVIDVKKQAHDDYVNIVDQRHENLVWTHPGMTNWYRNAKGRVVSVSPWRLVDYWQMTHDTPTSRTTTR